MDGFRGGRVVKWECRVAKPFRLVAEGADYYGHTLERVRGVAWSGWRCQWCGEAFMDPDEPRPVGYFSMEDVETEDESDVFKFVIKTCLSRGRTNALARSMIVDAKVAHLDRSCREVTFSRLSRGMI